MKNDENGNYDRQFYSNKPISAGDTNSQIQIYTGVGGGIFVKPNEILDINGVPSGNAAPFLVHFATKPIFNSLPGIKLDVSFLKIPNYGHFFPILPRAMKVEQV